MPYSETDSDFLEPQLATPLQTQPRSERNELGKIHQPLRRIVVPERVKLNRYLVSDHL